MGKGQKALQETATTRSNEQYQSAQDAKNRLINNQTLMDFKTRQAARRHAIETGQIADAKDFISNRAAVANRLEQYKTKANLTKTGIAGLASNYTNPNQIALANRLYEDEFARDSAAQAEADAKDYIAQTDANDQSIIALEQGRDAGIMNSSFGFAQNSMSQASQIAAQRASVLPSIIGSAISTGAGIITQSNWFNRGGGGASARPDPGTASS